MPNEAILKDNLTTIRGELNTNTQTACTYALQHAINDNKLFIN
jgi:hypothetical protein